MPDGPNRQGDLAFPTLKDDPLTFPELYGTDRFDFENPELPIAGGRGLSLLKKKQEPPWSSAFQRESPEAQAERSIQEAVREMRAGRFPEDSASEEIYGEEIPILVSPSNPNKAVRYLGPADVEGYVKVAPIGDPENVGIMSDRWLREEFAPLPGVLEAGAKILKPSSPLAGNYGPGLQLAVVREGNLPDAFPDLEEFFPGHSLLREDVRLRNIKGGWPSGDIKSYRLEFSKYATPREELSPEEESRALRDWWTKFSARAKAVDTPEGTFYRRKYGREHGRLFRMASYEERWKRGVPTDAEGRKAWAETMLRNPETGEATRRIAQALLDGREDWWRAAPIPEDVPRGLIQEYQVGSGGWRIPIAREEMRKTGRAMLDWGFLGLAGPVKFTTMSLGAVGGGYTLGEAAQALGLPREYGETLGSVAGMIAGHGAPGTIKGTAAWMKGAPTWMKGTLEDASNVLKYRGHRYKLATKRFEWLAKNAPKRPPAEPYDVPGGGSSVKTRGYWKERLSEWKKMSVQQRVQWTDAMEREYAARRKFGPQLQEKPVVPAEPAPPLAVEGQVQPAEPAPPRPAPEARPASPPPRPTRPTPAPFEPTTKTKAVPELVRRKITAHRKRGVPETLIPDLTEIETQLFRIRATMVGKTYETGVEDPMLRAEIARLEGQRDSILSTVKGMRAAETEGLAAMTGADAEAVIEVPEGKSKEAIARAEAILRGREEPGKGIRPSEAPEVKGAPPPAEKPQRKPSPVTLRLAGQYQAGRELAQSGKPMVTPPGLSKGEMNAFATGYKSGKGMELGKVDRVMSKRWDKALEWEPDVAVGQKAPEKPWWEMDVKEARAAQVKQQAREESVDVEVLGDAGAKEWARLMRQRNSGNVKKADAAEGRIREIESGLSEQDQNKLYGIGEAGEGSELLGDIADALEYVHDVEPEIALARAMSALGGKADPAKMSLAEKESYAQIREVGRRIEAEGLDGDEIVKKAVARAVGEHADPDDAMLLLRPYLERARAAQVAKRSKLPLFGAGVRSPSFKASLKEATEDELERALAELPDEGNKHRKVLMRKRLKIIREKDGLEPRRDASGKLTESTEEYYRRIAGEEHAFLVRKKGEPGMLYRGISRAELKDIQRRGRIKSKGLLNIGEGEEGTTLFTDSPQAALGYQTTVAHEKFRLRPGRPAYVIEIEHGGEGAADVAGIAKGDYAIPGEISADRIRRAWEISSPRKNAPLNELRIRQIKWTKRQTGIEAGGSAVPARTAPATPPDRFSEEADDFIKNQGVDDLEGVWDKLTDDRIHGDVSMAEAAEKAFRKVFGVGPRKMDSLSPEQTGLDGVRDFIAETLRERAKMEGVPPKLRVVGKGGEAEVPAKVVEEAERGVTLEGVERKPKGRCFNDAYDVIAEESGTADNLGKDAKNVVLVHGKARVITPTGKEKQGDHAWVEFTRKGKKFVWDPQQEKVFDLKDYYDRANAKPTYSMTEEQALVLSLRSGNSGPYTKAERFEMEGSKAGVPATPAKLSTAEAAAEAALERSQATTDFLDEARSRTTETGLDNTMSRAKFARERNEISAVGLARVMKEVAKSRAALKAGEVLVKSPVAVGYKKIDATDTVDGRTVRDANNVPNTEAISASIDEYKVLPGLREVPLSDFGLTGRHYSVEGNKRIRELADAIKASGEISPLIVVIDANPEGPYILEGATRSEALKVIAAKSFPALVVVDTGSIEDAMKAGKPVSAQAMEALGKSVVKGYARKGKAFVKVTPAKPMREPWQMTKEEIRDLSRADLDKLVWGPAAERIYLRAGSNDPQKIADFYSKKYGLPPMRVTNMHLKDPGAGGTSAIMEDGSLEIGLKPVSFFRSEAERTINLRHEIEHHIDRAKGFKSKVEHPFKVSGSGEIEIVPGHHENFEVFDADYAHRALVHDAIKAGKKVPPAVVKSRGLEKAVVKDEFDKLQAIVDARRARAKELAKRENPIPFQDPKTGNVAWVSKDTGIGKWRFSRINKAGPVGHSVANTKEQAYDEMLEAGYTDEVAPYVVEKIVLSDKYQEGVLRADEITGAAKRPTSPVAKARAKKKAKAKTVLDISPEWRTKEIEQIRGDIRDIENEIVGLRRRANVTSDLDEMRRIRKKWVEADTRIGGLRIKIEELQAPLSERAGAFLKRIESATDDQLGSLQEEIHKAANAKEISVREREALLPRIGERHLALQAKKYPGLATQEAAAKKPSSPVAKARAKKKAAATPEKRIETLTPQRKMAGEEISRLQTAERDLQIEVSRAAARVVNAHRELRYRLATVHGVPILKSGQLSKARHYQERLGKIDDALSRDPDLRELRRVEKEARAAWRDVADKKLPEAREKATVLGNRIRKAEAEIADRAKAKARAIQEKKDAQLEADHDPEILAAIPVGTKTGVQLRDEGLEPAVLKPEFFGYIEMPRGDEPLAYPKGAGHRYEVKVEVEHEGVKYWSDGKLLLKGGPPPGAKHTTHQMRHIQPETLMETVRGGKELPARPIAMLRGSGGDKDIKHVLFRDKDGGLYKYDQKRVRILLEAGADRWAVAKVGDEFSVLRAYKGREFVGTLAGIESDLPVGVVAVASNRFFRQLRVDQVEAVGKPKLPKKPPTRPSWEAKAGLKWEAATKEKSGGFKVVHPPLKPKLYPDIVEPKKGEVLIRPTKASLADRPPEEIRDARQLIRKLAQDADFKNNPVLTYEKPGTLTWDAGTVRYRIGADAMIPDSDLVATFKDGDRIRLSRLWYETPVNFFKKTKTRAPKLRKEGVAEIIRMTGEKGKPVTLGMGLGGLGGPSKPSKRQMRKIHAATSRLGLDSKKNEQAYRDFLEMVTGKRSMSDMTYEDASKLEFEVKIFTVTKASRPVFRESLAEVDTNLKKTLSEDEYDALREQFKELYENMDAPPGVPMSSEELYDLGSGGIHLDYYRNRDFGYLTQSPIQWLPRMLGPQLGGQIKRPIINATQNEKRLLTQTLRAYRLLMSTLDKGQRITVIRILEGQEDWARKYVPMHTPIGTEGEKLAEMPALPKRMPSEKRMLVKTARQIRAITDSLLDTANWVTVNRVGGLPSIPRANYFPQISKDLQEHYDTLEPEGKVRNIFTRFLMEREADVPYTMDLGKVLEMHARAMIRHIAWQEILKVSLPKWEASKRMTGDAKKAVRNLVEYSSRSTRPLADRVLEATVEGALGEKAALAARSASSLLHATGIAYFLWGNLSSGIRNSTQFAFQMFRTNLRDTAWGFSQWARRTKESKRIAELVQAIQGRFTTLDEGTLTTKAQRVLKGFLKIGLAPLTVTEIWNRGPMTLASFRSHMKELEKAGITGDKAEAIAAAEAYADMDWGQLMFDRPGVPAFYRGMHVRGMFALTRFPVGITHALKDILKELVKGPMKPFYVKKMLRRSIRYRVNADDRIPPTKKKMEMEKLFEQEWPMIRRTLRHMKGFSTGIQPLGEGGLPVSMDPGGGEAGSPPGGARGWWRENMAVRDFSMYWKLLSAMTTFYGVYWFWRLFTGAIGAGVNALLSEEDWGPDEGGAEAPEKEQYDGIMDEILANGIDISSDLRPDRLIAKMEAGALIQEGRDFFKEYDETGDLEAALDKRKFPVAIRRMIRAMEDKKRGFFQKSYGPERDTTGRLVKPRSPWHSIVRAIGMRLPGEEGEQEDVREARQERGELVYDRGKLAEKAFWAYRQGDKAALAEVRKELVGSRIFWDAKSRTAWKDFARSLGAKAEKFEEVREPGLAVEREGEEVTPLTEEDFNKGLAWASYLEAVREGKAARAHRLRMRLWKLGIHERPGDTRRRLKRKAEPSRK